MAEDPIATELDDEYGIAQRIAYPVAALEKATDCDAHPRPVVKGDYSGQTLDGPTELGVTESGRVSVLPVNEA